MHRFRETPNSVGSIEALADELTGLFNRRAFKQSADKCFELSRRGSGADR
jgi:GGDEF domain-containing protein